MPERTDFESNCDVDLQKVQAELMKLDGLITAAVRCGDAIAGRADPLNRNRDFEAMKTLIDLMQPIGHRLTRNVDQLLSD